MVLDLGLFERKPGVAMREWFFIEQGKIRSICASLYYPEKAAFRWQLADHRQRNSVGEGLGGDHNGHAAMGRVRLSIGRLWLCFPLDHHV